MNVRAVEHVRDQVVLPIVERSWAAYTPYYAVEPYEQPPVDCKVTQVGCIQRHGARYPTSGSGPLIQSAVAKLKSVDVYTDHRLDFLKKYTYTLGVADLVTFGALEAQLAGEMAYERYSHIVSHDKLPFVRTSGGQRVVDSAQNWTLGFSIASGRVYEPPVSVILSESDGKNNTLDDKMCPNAGYPDEYTTIWTNIFGPPIADRLNAQAPGAGITPEDVPSLMSLCAFDTVATSSLSPFCQLFSPEEFAEYEYLGDVEKYYNTGYGQRLGRVQGVGYVNELIARLTNTPVHDTTQTNRTLDASPLTFPLNQTLYADFSHDNQMIAIYAAMGLFRQRKNRDLDPTRPDPERTWIASRLTPFSARMVTERLECDGHSSWKNDGGLEGSITSKKRSGEYVRIFVNDAIQPLEFCGGDRDQLCELDKFVESQVYSRHDGEGDFEKCFN
ncbi:phytase [Crepidotus variabilis]|uniref:Phytase A n=1 Tax=Crepidotus variabilis TaxID=179855 RepID=A0A9P6E428_9AGAR|nr:phytase [Crepidotus variabilis]